MLHDFTKNNIHKFLIKKIKDNNFLLNLKKTRSLIIKFIKNNPVKYKIEKVEIEYSKIKELCDTMWVCTNVVKSLNLLTSNFKISWLYKNVEHTIYIKSTLKKFEYFLVDLALRLNIINYIYDTKKNKKDKPITIYLVLSELKKQFTNTTHITPSNINSGYTDCSTREIFIWREEECDKLIFHELIHYMELDIPNDIVVKNPYLECIDGSMNYQEAFTDYHAIIYNTIFISIILRKSVTTLFQIEYNFIKNQANYFYDFFSLNKCIKIKQPTPTFSYLFVKYLIFKKLIESNNITLLNNPKVLLETIFNEPFIYEKYIDCNSSRMTILQVK
jgi:hypothetical protein